MIGVPPHENTMRTVTAIETLNGIDIIGSVTRNLSNREMTGRE